MKKIIFAILLFQAKGPLTAQFNHTIWKGGIKGDNPRNALLDFRKDTLFLLAIADSSIEETMTYNLADNTLIIQKISGLSDCDNLVIGKYKYSILGGILNINLLSDPCDDRSSALDNTKWQRWKNHLEVQVDQSILKEYIGEYELDPGHHILISLKNGRLQAEGPNNNLPLSPLFAESKTKFFLKLAGVEIDFVKNNKGEVVELISHEQKDVELKKIK